jgi:tRNA (Thr-GGU) A37 N-methylase
VPRGNEEGFVLRPIGTVESPLADRDAAPRQGDGGASDAWLALDPRVREAPDGTPVLDIEPALGPIDER